MDKESKDIPVLAPIGKTDVLRDGTVVPQLPITKTFTFDPNTVMFMVYLMFKANLITRYGLIHILKVIKDTKAELDINEYLIAESKKI